MNENGEQAPAVQQSRQDEVLKKMFKKMDTKVEGEITEGFALDSDLAKKSDFHLQQYAKEHARNAKKRETELGSLPESATDTQRNSLQQIVDGLNKKALETATVVTGEGLENSRDRIKLLTEYHRSLIDSLPGDLATHYKRSRDRSLSDEQQTKAREEFQRRFEKIRDPKIRDRIEQTLQTISEVGKLRFDIDNEVAKVEDRKGKTLIDRFKSFWRGEMNVGDLRTQFARWLSKKTGLRYEVFEDPKTMSSATREMMGAGADGFELLSASVREDIDNVTNEVAEEQRQAKEAKKETPEEAKKRAEEEQAGLTEEEKKKQEAMDKITQLYKDLQDKKITEEEFRNRIGEIDRQAKPEKSVAELDKEQDEEIEDRKAAGSELPEVDATRMKGLIKELHDGKNLTQVAAEIFPGNNPAAAQRRKEFIERFQEGMKTIGLVTEDEIKSMSVGELEKVYRRAAEKALKQDERAKLDREYKKYKHRLFWYYILESMWDELKSGMKEGLSQATT